MTRRPRLSGRRAAGFASLVMLAAAMLAVQAWAKNLGVRGATWSIAELDLLMQIETRLHDMQRSGEMARIEAEVRSRARSRLEEPEPVPGIAPAQEYRTRLFDPAIVVAQDIHGPDGQLLAAAGTRIDPFAHAPFSRNLLFVDGRRDVEVAWALEHTEPAKIVLLAGRPLDLMRRHGRPVFFDAGGRLAERFGLRFTPALVERAGLQLRISEIPVEDRDRPQTEQED